MSSGNRSRRAEGEQEGRAGALYQQAEAALRGRGRDEAIRLFGQIVETVGGTRREEAEARWNRLKPEHARELARQGEEALARGDVEAAFSDLERAAALVPDDPTIMGIRRDCRGSNSP